jgi:outer membrane protein assembly factor BamB
MSRFKTITVLAVLGVLAAMSLAQAAEKAAAPAFAKASAGGVGATTIDKGASAIPTVGGGSIKAAPGDWPQWRGPNRDGISPEKGLLQQWPAGGPPLLWKVSGIGRGFSGPSVAGGRVYVMGTRENMDVVFCYDMATQQLVWAGKVGSTELDGPRCNVAIDGNRVYALGPAGHLVAFDAATGKQVWYKNLHKDFNGRLQGDYAYCESPLVDGDKLIVTPGGMNDAMMVALNKETGDVIWKFALPDIGGYGHWGTGYSSVVVSEGGGVRQYVQIVGCGLVGVRASDGKFLWGYGKIAQGHSNIPTPLCRGDYVFESNAYEPPVGACLLKLRANPDEKGGVVAEEVWTLPPDRFENTCGQAVLVGDYLYSSHGTRGGVPVCVEFATGKLMWRMDKQPAPGVCGVVYADNRIIYRFAAGNAENVFLIEPDPTGWKQVGALKCPGDGHSIPVVANGKLLLRAGDTLYCYDLKKH